MEVVKMIEPTDVSMFVGNKNIIRNITEFFSRKSDDLLLKNILCILGPGGCGKTVLCKLLFKKYNINVLELGKDNLTLEDTKNMLYNFANNTTIEQFMIKRDKIVFVDDVDILMNADKCIVSKILSCNKALKRKKIKIILTCNINEEKKLHDTVKDIDIIKLYYPSIKDSYTHIMFSFDEHGINYEPEHLLNVVTKHKGSIRESILNMYNTNEELDTKEVEVAFKDMNTFEIAKNILNKSSNLQNVEYLIRGDIGVLPYVLYENFPDELDTNYKFKRGKNNTNLIDTYLAINKYFIDASTFEESAYQSLDWSLLSYANALRMKSIFTGMIELEKKATHKDVKYRFSQILSKMSHKNIMAKKVRTVSASMNVSNTSTLVAVDMNLQTLQNMQNVKKSPLEKTKKEKGKKITSTLENDLIQEKTCVINTYEKYFV
jgi:hypothetical protein